MVHTRVPSSPVIVNDQSIKSINWSTVRFWTNVSNLQVVTYIDNVFYLQRLRNVLNISTVGTTDTPITTRFKFVNIGLKRQNNI